MKHTEPSHFFLNIYCLSKSLAVSVESSLGPTDKGPADSRATWTVPHGHCPLDSTFENDFSEEVQLHGIKFICDTKNISWKHLNVVPPKIKQKWSAAVSKAYPIRIRGIIYVNVRI